MAFIECGAFLLAFEEGFSGVSALRSVAAAGIVHHHNMRLLERFDCACRVERGFAVGEQLLECERRTHCHDGFGVVGDDDVPAAKVQAFREDADKARVEGKGAAFEHHRGLNLKTLRQATDGLLGDGMERRQGDISLGYALVEQGLDVGFRVYAAAAGNVVHRLALLGQVAELLGGNLQERGDFVHKSAGAACAASVHAHVGNGKAPCFFVVLEEDHLRVLAAQLDGGAGSGVMGAYGKGVGHHFLHIGQVQRFC